MPNLAEQMREIAQNSIKADKEKLRFEYDRMISASIIWLDKKFNAIFKTLPQQIRQAAERGCTDYRLSIYYAKEQGFCVVHASEIVVRQRIIEKLDGYQKIVKFCQDNGFKIELAMNSSPSIFIDIKY